MVNATAPNIRMFIWCPSKVLKRLSLDTVIYRHENAVRTAIPLFRPGVIDSGGINEF
jgi:hypothetical protein